MANFEFEQQILDAWRIVDDIKLMAEGQSDVSDFAGVAALYDLKFQKLWKAYEDSLPGFERAVDEPESTVVGTDSSPVITRNIAFADDGDQQFKISYADYGTSGWILGIDGEHEQVSIQLKDLNLLIHVLKRLVV